ncbi:hypothetical protein ABW19_dt0203550 [Dactylella cylindrospora]|nr:hypothetical protein ABW19_dt0203550 [Dactylella cylindrospora]
MSAHVQDFFRHFFEITPSGLLQKITISTDVPIDEEVVDILFHRQPNIKSIILDVTPGHVPGCVNYKIMCDRQLRELRLLGIRNSSELDIFLKALVSSQHTLQRLSFKFTERLIEDLEVDGADSIEVIQLMAKSAFSILEDGLDIQNFQLTRLEEVEIHDVENLSDIVEFFMPHFPNMVDFRSNPVSIKLVSCGLLGEILAKRAIGLNITSLNVRLVSERDEELGLAYFEKSSGLLELKLTTEALIPR